MVAGAFDGSYLFSFIYTFLSPMSTFIVFHCLHLLREDDGYVLISSSLVVFVGFDLRRRCIRTEVDSEGVKNKRFSQGSRTTLAVLGVEIQKTSFPTPRNLFRSAVFC